MKVLYSPQRNDNKIVYEFNGEVITASIGEESDTFDFTSMPDGIATNITTTLGIKPIVSAKRVNGELQVVLVNFIGANASEKERFPDWQVIE